VISAAPNLRVQRQIENDSSVQVPATPGAPQPALPVVRVDSAARTVDTSQPVHRDSRTPSAKGPTVLVQRSASRRDPPPPSEPEQPDSRTSPNAREFVVHADAEARTDSAFAYGNAYRSTALTLGPMVQRALDTGSDAPGGSTPSAVSNVSIPIQPPAAPAPASAELDVTRVADQVYSLLVERLASERDRRGY
jgi:hypothetical protein